MPIIHIHHNAQVVHTLGLNQAKEICRHRFLPHWETGPPGVARPVFVVEELDILLVNAPQQKLKCSWEYRISCLSELRGSWRFNQRLLFVVHH